MNSDWLSLVVNFFPVVVAKPVKLTCLPILLCYLPATFDAQAFPSALPVPALFAVITICVSPSPKTYLNQEILVLQ